MNISRFVKLLIGFHVFILGTNAIYHIFHFSFHVSTINEILYNIYNLVIGNLSKMQAKVFLYTYNIYIHFVKYTEIALSRVDNLFFIYEETSCFA